ELALKADDRQLATLLPVLARHREQVGALLCREAQKEARPNWNDPPLDPSWQAPPPELHREVEAAQGWLADRFALVQTLPLERFEALAAKLRPCGYRPARFRGYRLGPEVRVAAVWTRDGRDARLVQGVSAEQ